MKIREAKIRYRTVREIDVTALDSPESVYEYMHDAFDEDPTVEWFFTIILNRKNKPLGRSMITKGTATSSLVHAREVLKPVILAGGSAAILCHNHPSGDPTPSTADTWVTKKLKEGFQVMGIDLLDHVIMGAPDSDPCGQGFYSYKESGVLSGDFEHADLPELCASIRKLKKERG